MFIYKYQPYYKYDGATYLQPFRDKLTPDEIEYNLKSFFLDVDRYFKDGTATFNKLSEDCIEIKTDISEAECDSRVNLCLNALDLYAHKTCKS